LSFTVFNKKEILAHGANISPCLVHLNISWSEFSYLLNFSPFNQLSTRYFMFSIVHFHTSSCLLHFLETSKMLVFFYLLSLDWNHLNDLWDWKNFLRCVCSRPGERWIYGLLDKKWGAWIVVSFCIVWICLHF
jgi:hypothetical protein